MQSYVTTFTFSDIVRKKAKKIPGKLHTVAVIMGVCDSTLQNKLKAECFTTDDLKAMDRLLFFTEEEKAMVWK